NYVIRKVTKANGKITTVGGSHVYGFGGDGSSALAALISNVYGLTVDSAGSVVTLADYNNNRIRQFTVGGNMNTIAGSGAGGFCGDGGPATSACLSGPEGLGFDGSGHLFIADASNYRVREVIGGNINTVAGNGSNTQPTTTNHVPPSGVVFNYPIGVFGDTSSNIFIADTQNSRVRQLVHSTNLVDLFAGTGTAGYNGDNQPAVNAQLSNPSGTLKHAAGNLYIADTYNHAIRKVDTAGKITTFAGSPQHCGYTGDGGPATTAWMCYPAGLAIDSSNAIYVADSSNH